MMDKVDHFYGQVLGLSSDIVPDAQKHRLRWFKIGQHGQQVSCKGLWLYHNKLTPYAQLHCSLEKPEQVSKQVVNSHPCFTIPLDQLQPLQDKLLAFSQSGHPAACTMTEGMKAGVCCLFFN